MSAVGITENAKGDNKKFEIWCNSREEVYIVQVHIVGFWSSFTDFLDNKNTKKQRSEYNVHVYLQVTVVRILQFTLSFLS